MRKRESIVSHSNSMLVRCNLHLIRELPAPRFEWSYTEMAARIGHSILTRLRDSGLIIRIEEGVYRTSEKLTRYVQEKHGVSLGMGEQTSLDVFSVVV